jgi:hypothetical protein
MHIKGTMTRLSVACRSLAIARQIFIEHLLYLYVAGNEEIDFSVLKAGAVMFALFRNFNTDYVFNFHSFTK